MIDKLKKTIQDASELLKQQASALGEGAKEKSYQIIEDWLQVFPKLEIYGLEMTTFALSVALSPALEVEFKAPHQSFPPERISQILKENHRNPMILSVFNTIKTTYSLHRKIYGTLKEPLIVKIKIKISPEIKVYIGRPLIE